MFVSRRPLRCRCALTACRLRFCLSCWPHAPLQLAQQQRWSCSPNILSVPVVDSRRVCRTERGRAEHSRAMHAEGVSTVCPVQRTSLPTESFWRALLFVQHVEQNSLHHRKTAIKCSYLDLCTTKLTIREKNEFLISCTLVELLCCKLSYIIYSSKVSKEQGCTNFYDIFLFTAIPTSHCSRSMEKKQD